MLCISDYLVDIPVGKRLDAELLLAHVLKISRESVFAYPEKKLSTDEMNDFQAYWQRVESGEPTAYLLGKQEFFGLNFIVDSRVLIPRPETEHLVETIIELASGIEAPRILDVGTGCGAIALSLAKTLPRASIWASDVSSDAIDVARLNAAALDLDHVDLKVSNLLSDLDCDAMKLDILVANLPYIGVDRFHFVEKAVEDNEPHVALFGGTDGLRLYVELFEQIKALDALPRWILGEFGSLQRELLETIIYDCFPESVVSFHKDLAGLDRFFTLELNHA
jgi:release factor glutamine methyltransferase